MAKVAIWVRPEGAGRTTAWVVKCDDCGELVRSGSKPGATRVAVSHSESEHNRFVRIHIAS